MISGAWRVSASKSMTLMSRLVARSNQATVEEADGLGRGARLLADDRLERDSIARSIAAPPLHQGRRKAAIAHDADVGTTIRKARNGRFV